MRLSIPVSPTRQTVYVPGPEGPKGDRGIAGAKGDKGDPGLKNVHVGHTPPENPVVGMVWIDFEESDS
jgi:hypothetical protein